MNIGYVYPFEASPPRGGNRLHAYQLIQHFLGRGHSIATLGDASMPEVRSFPRTSDGVRELGQAVDVLYIRVDANHLIRAPLVLELLDHAEVPVVWEVNAPANESLAFSWLGGREAGTTIPARWLDRLRRTLHAARQKPGIAREEALRRRLAKKVDAAVCVSESVGRYTRSALDIGMVKIVPNASDPVANHPDRDPVALPERFRGRLKVLFAGSPIYPWQGLDQLLNAAEGSGEAFVFLLLVNQPLQRQVPDNVMVLEGVSYAEVGRYICTADVCLALQPDFWWSPWGFHGSPMKLFDYMACGKPVVTTGVGQLGDLVRRHENGLICEPTGIDLREKLLYLKHHPEQAVQMGANSRQAVVDYYNWERAADETLDVFEAVLERSRLSV
jgi:glycosyltransferase involved in cell wall biosynthesis